MIFYVKQRHCPESFKQLSFLLLLLKIPYQERHPESSPLAILSKRRQPSAHRCEGTLRALPLN